MIDHDPRFGWVLYDGECGFCAWWVPFWGSTLHQAGFGIEPFEGAPDIMVRLIDGNFVHGAAAYRFVMRRIWWAYPVYVMSLIPGFSHMFNWGYSTFARNRYCVSRAVGLDGTTHVRR